MVETVEQALARTGKFLEAPKLPIGLQLLGKPFGEEVMLKIAHADDTGWHKERAQIS